MRRLRALKKARSLITEPEKPFRRGQPQSKLPLSRRQRCAENDA